MWKKRRELVSPVANRPFIVDGNAIPMTACFSVAASSGRSSLIVLRESERALSLAAAEGHGTNSVCIVGEITVHQTSSVAIVSAPQHRCHGVKRTRQSLSHRSGTLLPLPKADNSVMREGRASVLDIREFPGMPGTATRLPGTSENSSASVAQRLTLQ